MYKNINELEEKIDFSITDNMVIETEKASKKSSVEFFKKDHTEEILYIEAEDLIVLNSEKGQKKIKYSNFKTHSCLDFNKIGEIDLNENYNLVNQDRLRTKLLNLINSFDISNNIYNGLSTSNKGIISAINELYDLIDNRPPIEPPIVEVEVFELEVSTLDLQINSNYTFNPTILPSNATDKTITWEIDSNIAYMVGNTIKCINVGTCTVSARCGNKISTCFVTITEQKYIPVEVFELDKTTLELDKGSSYTFNPTILPLNASDKTITWKFNYFNGVEVATMSTVGNKLTARLPGGCSLTATCGNIRSTCLVTVNDVYTPISKITVSPTSKTLSRGASEKLIVTTIPFSSPNNKKTWVSSNTSLVTVEQDGTITSLATRGTANVTVSCDGLSATCVVTCAK